MCHPSSLLGFNLPLLVPPGTLAGSFGGKAKSNNARHNPGRRLHAKWKKPLHQSCLRSVVRLGCTPLFPSASLDFKFQGFFPDVRFIYLFCNPSLCFVSLFCSWTVPFCPFDLTLGFWVWSFWVRESPGVCTTAEVLLSVFKCILHLLKACPPPALLCCLRCFKIRH